MLYLCIVKLLKTKIMEIKVGDSVQLVSTKHTEEEFGYLGISNMLKIGETAKVVKVYDDSILLECSIKYSYDPRDFEKI